MEIEMQKISEKLQIPMRILEWHMQNNKDLNNNVHYRYCPEEQTFKVTLVGFIILICSNISTDYEKIAEVLELFFIPKKDNSFLLTLQTLINEQLGAENKDAPVKKKTASDSEKVQEPISDDIVPCIADTEAIEWSVRSRSTLAFYVRDQNKKGIKCTFAGCLKRIYSLISKKYGIDFKEAKDDFCKAYDLPEDTKVSNFRIISESPSGRNIFSEVMQQLITNQVDM